MQLTQKLVERSRDKSDMTDVRSGVQAEKCPKPCTSHSQVSKKRIKHISQRESFVAGGRTTKTYEKIWQLSRREQNIALI